MSNIKATQRNDVTSIRRSLHRNTDLAYLGRTADPQAELFVNDRPGYWWVRELQGGGTTGPAIQVRGSLMPINVNNIGSTVVKLGIEEGEKAVIKIDFISAVAQNVNPTQSAVVDPNANNPSFVNQAFIATAFEQIVEGTLTVALRGAVPLAAGVFVKVEGLFDFTGNIPTSGEHCLAVTAIQSDLVTTETQYSTAKPDQIPLDIDDLNEAWALMSDTLTNKPLWSWSIGDGQTTLVEANRWMDIRQFLNWDTTSGGGSFYQTVQGNGTPATQEPIIDFIDGTNTTVTVTDDGAGTRTKVKIDVSGVTSGINQLTGDVTAGPGTGSQAATLATVNSNVGSFTLASITVNAKGLITAAATGLVNLATQVSGSLGLSHGGTGVDLSASGGTTQVLAQDASHVISARNLVAADIPNLDAAKITSGTLALARGGTNADLSASGGTTAILAQDASHVVSARNLVAADIPNLDASKITTGQIALARGGTHADLSGTGGSNQFLKQSSVGADITVAAIVSADINSALTTPGPIGSSSSDNITAKTLLLRSLATLTISSNTVAVTQSFHKLTSLLSSDTLNTASGGTNGQLLILTGTSGKTLTITNGAGGTGQFLLQGSVNFILSNSSVDLYFQYDGTSWIQISGTVVPGEAIGVGTVSADRLGLPYGVVFYGDGTDGNLTASSGTTTLTRDTYYNNITLTGTAKINTAGYRLFYNGTCDLSAAPAGAIFNDGGTGGNASSGTGGSGGAAPASQTIGGGSTAPVGANGRATSGGGTNGTAGVAATPGNGGAGGNGGNGGAGTGGAGGTAQTGGAVTSAQSMNRWAIDLLRGASLLLGGASGASGSSGGSNGAQSGGGGQGGSGGGVVWMSGRNLKLPGGTISLITAKGGTGGNGANSAGAANGDGGGGGGGGGGWIYCAYGALTGSVTTNALDASGGTGGNAGTAGSTATVASGGDGGSGGRITLVNLLANTTAETTGSAGTAHSGRTGGAGNTFQANL